MNIGNRQAGRIRHGHVFDVSSNANAISFGLSQAIERSKRLGFPRPTLQPKIQPATFIGSWLRACPTF